MVVKLFSAEQFICGCYISTLFDVMYVFIWRYTYIEGIVTHALPILVRGYGLRW